MDVSREFEIFSSKSLDIASQMVKPYVFDRLLTPVLELTEEGKEGKPLGTLFVLGNHEKVMEMSTQMIINPFADVLISLNPPKIILRSFDIILYEIIAGLNFNKHHIFRTRILDAVPGDQGHIQGITECQLNAFIIPGRHRLAANHTPMLGVPGMALIAQPPAGINGGPLDLVIRGVRKDFIKAPGSMLLAAGPSDDPFINPDVILHHTFRTETLLDPLTASVPIDLLDFCYGPGHLIKLGYHKARDAFSDDLRHTTTVHGDNWRSAGHSLHYGKSERLIHLPGQRIGALKGNNPAAAVGQHLLRVPVRRGNSGLAAPQGVGECA